jgi:protein involved in polysaccharide export with SLBB domain
MCASKGGRKGSEKQNEFISEEVNEATIQRGDELYIRVSSSDEKPNSFSYGQNNSISSDVTLLSYTVDERGSVKLPYIGEIRLNDMSLPEASDTIENLLSQFLYITGYRICW